MRAYDPRLAASLALLAAPQLAPAIDSNWTGTTGGTPSNWSQGSNWSTNPLVPNAAGDRATLNNAQTTLDLAVTLLDLNMGGSASLFAVSGSPQALVVKGAFNLSGSASGFFANGLTLQVDGTGTISRDGPYNFSGRLDVSAGRTLTHQGTSTLVLGGGGVINNSGSWEAQTTGTFGGISTSAGPGFFNNLAGGTLRKTGAATTLYSIGRIFANAGTLLVEGGQLALDGGANLDGTITIGEGARLSFGGTSSVAPTTAFTINGFLGIKLAATFSLEGNLTLAGTGTLQTLGSGGTPSIISIGAGRTLDFGPVALEFAGAAQISGGSSILRSTGLLTASSSLQAHTLTLAPGAVFTHPGTAQLGFNNATLINNATYRATGNGFFLTGPASRFTNNGTFDRLTSAGNFLSQIPFDNNGTVLVETGSLEFSGGGAAGSQGGPFAGAEFNVFAGAKLRFSSNYSHSGTVNLTGAGTLEIASGTQTINDSQTWNISNVSFQGGTISVTAGKFLLFPNANFTTNNTTTFSGGGVTVIHNGTQTSAFSVAASTTLQSDGNVAFNGTGRIDLGGAGATFRNTGTLTFAGTGGINGTGLFDNPANATIDVAPPSGTTIRLFPGFSSAGSVHVGPGTTLRVDNYTDVQGGSLLRGRLDLEGFLDTAGTGPVTTLGADSTVIFDGGSWTQLSTTDLTANGVLVVNSPAFPRINLIHVGGTMYAQALSYGETQVNATGTLFFDIPSPYRPNRAGGRPAAPPGTDYGDASSMLKVSGQLRALGTVNGTVLNNAGGTITAPGPGTLTFTGCVTNNGTMIISGGAALVVTSNCFTNNGTLDLITGSFTPPPGFVNNGLILGPSAVTVKNTVKAGNTVTLQIDGYTGHSYQLQRSTGLDSASFVNLGAPQQGVTGNVLSFVDNAAAGTHGFYRILVN